MTNGCTSGDNLEQRRVRGKKWTFSCPLSIPFLGFGSWSSLSVWNLIVGKAFGKTWFIKLSMIEHEKLDKWLSFFNIAFLC
jgi:hypothetical protein